MDLGCGTPTKILRPQNFKSVVMATVIARYSQNLIRSRSSWGKHTLKIWGKSVHWFRLWNTHKLYSVDSGNFKKWGLFPNTAKNVGEGLKILGDDFMIKLKLMKNTFSVNLDIFNSGLILISDQGHLATQ